MIMGALAAGLLAVVLVEAVKRYGRVEPGAAMGVVFSVMFALGVLMLERTAIRQVDLDADCVLHGQLETLVWYNAPQTWLGVLQWSTLGQLPRQVVLLLVTAAAAVVFIALFFKELRIAAFDPLLATTQGYSARLLHYALMCFVATATVASFEAVGSILVIAMLICPAATARLLTDRLLPQVVWSVAVAGLCAVAGYVAASWVPGLFGRDAVNAAGSITVASGLVLASAVVCSPRHGVLVKALRRRDVAREVAYDDLLATLYRRAESGQHDIEASSLGWSAKRALRAAVRAQHVVRNRNAAMALSESGRLAALAIVRKHRLWEHYLVEQGGYRADHVHDAAELFEHTGTTPPGGPHTDPHGRRIP